MAVVTFIIKLKNPTKTKHKQWVTDQIENTNCLNWCVQEIYNGNKLSSRDVPFKLKSCIKNEAIRKQEKQFQII